MKNKEKRFSIHADFKRVNHLTSTRTAEAYIVVRSGVSSALESEKKDERLILWVMRYPLGIGSEASKTFIERIDLIKKINRGKKNVFGQTNIFKRQRIFGEYLPTKIFPDKDRNQV